MTLGEKIKYYREIQKIGQENLAALSHISVSAIRKYESGERIPKESQLEKLAIALHISPVALKDVHFDSFIDLLPYLYEISKTGDIAFDGPKDSDGKYIPEELNLKFKNSDFQSFFKEWADRKAECDQIKKAADEISDSPTKEMMLKRVSDIEAEIEQKLVTERIINNIYQEYDIPKSYYSSRSKKGLPALKTYADFLNMLNNLARTSIKFECVGLHEKGSGAKCVFTFEANSIKIENMSIYAEDTFSLFLHYFDEFSQKYRTRTDAYTYQQGLQNFYRFIIEDRVLVAGLSIINEILATDIASMDGYERNDFDDNIKEEIKQFNVPIEMKV